MNTLADFKRCRIIQKTETIKFTAVVNVGNKVDLTIEALFSMGGLMVIIIVIKIVIKPVLCL